MARQFYFLVPARPTDPTPPGAMLVELPNMKLPSPSRSAVQIQFVNPPPAPIEVRPVAPIQQFSNVWASANPQPPQVHPPAYPEQVPFNPGPTQAPLGPTPSNPDTNVVKPSNPLTFIQRIPALLTIGFFALIFILMCVDLGLKNWVTYCSADLGLQKMSFGEYFSGSLSEYEDLICGSGSRRLESSDCYYCPDTDEYDCQQLCGYTSCNYYCGSSYYSSRCNYKCKEDPVDESSPCGDPCANVKRMRQAGQVMLAFGILAILLTVAIIARLILLQLVKKNIQRGLLVKTAAAVATALWVIGVGVYIALYVMTRVDATETTQNAGLYLAIAVAILLGISFVLNLVTISPLIRD